MQLSFNFLISKESSQGIYQPVAALIHSCPPQTINTAPDAQLGNDLIAPHVVLHASLQAAAAALAAAAEAERQRVAAAAAAAAAPPYATASQHVSLRGAAGTSGASLEGGGPFFDPLASAEEEARRQALRKVGAGVTAGGFRQVQKRSGMHFC